MEGTDAQFSSRNAMNRWAATIARDLLEHAGRALASSPASPPIYGTLDAPQRRPDSPSSDATVAAPLRVDTKDPRWVELFVRYFIDPLPAHLDDSHPHQMDDLLFFVRYPHPTNKHLDPVFVKRKVANAVPALDDLIAWKETFFLNFLAQLQFDMTVSVCERVAASDDTTRMVALNAITRPVFASPNAVQMDKKTHHNRLTYPTLYFYVNDFEEAFRDLVVESDKFLCVELSLVLPGVDSNNGSGDLADSQKEARISVVLFQGAVPYTALKSVYDKRLANAPVPSPAIKALQRLSKSVTAIISNDDDAVMEDDVRIEYVMMRGPNGKGHAQVAVSASSDAPSNNAVPPSNALNALASSWKKWTRSPSPTPRIPSPSPSPESPKLSCKMTYIHLPWTSIVQDLFDKVQQE